MNTPASSISEPRSTWRSKLQAIGPGVLMASAAVGGSHIIASTQAGAIYGWQLAMIVVLVNLFKYPFFRCGAQVLLVFRAEATRVPPRSDARLPVPAHGTTGPGHFCMSAAENTFDSWRKHLELHGIEIEADFIWPQGGRSIYFRDPAGNSIEIADPAIWN